MDNNTKITLCCITLLVILSSCIQSVQYSSISSNETSSTSTNLKVKRGQQLFCTIFEANSNEHLEIKLDDQTIHQMSLDNIYPLIGFYWDKRLLVLDKQAPFEFTYTISENDTIGKHTIEFKYEDSTKKLNKSFSFNVID